MSLSLLSRDFSFFLCCLVTFVIVFYFVDFFFLLGIWGRQLFAFLGIILLSTAQQIGKYRPFFCFLLPALLASPGSQLGGETPAAISLLPMSICHTVLSEASLLPPLPSGSQWGLQPDSFSTTITAGATAGSKLHLWLPSLSCSPICLPYSFQYAHLQMLLSQIHLYAKQRILCWIIIVWIINFSVDKRGFLIPPWCLHFRKIIFFL